MKVTHAVRLNVMKLHSKCIYILIAASVSFATPAAIADEKVPADVGWYRYIYPELTRSPGAFECKPSYFTKNFTLIFSEFKKYWLSNPEAKSAREDFGRYGPRMVTMFLYQSLLEFYPEEKDLNRVPSSYFLESDSATPYIHRYDYPVDFFMVCDSDFGEQFQPLRDLTKSFVGSFKSYRDALKGGNKKQISRAKRLLKKKIGSKSVSAVKKLYTSSLEKNSD